MEKLTKVSLVKYANNDFELKTYQNSFFVGGELPPLLYKRRSSVPHRREDSNARSKRRVQELIRCNPNLNKFITLTFAENITEFEVANKLFKEFIVKLNNLLNRKVAYVTVIEFQKRGAIHYHFLSDIPFIPQRELQGVWGHGFVFVNKIFDTRHAGFYITKYMNKSVGDERYTGKKFYQCSKYLNRPEKFYVDVSNDTALDLLFNYGLDVNLFYPMYSYQTKNSGICIVWGYMLNSS